MTSLRVAAEERRNAHPTIRSLAERIVTLSSNAHAEQVSRLRAIHVLSETLIDVLDDAPIDIMKSGTSETDTGVIFLPELRWRSVPDPLGEHAN